MVCEKHHLYPLTNQIAIVFEQPLKSAKYKPSFLSSFIIQPIHATQSWRATVTVTVLR
jgi:hypothetical protein